MMKTNSLAGVDTVSQTKSAIIFWKVLNIYFRFVGIMFIAIGTIVSIYGFISLSDPQVSKLNA